jgi:hypothetical protein
MELLILSFLTATGKVWALSRLLGFNRLLRLSRWFDLFFIFALPLMFYGTFNGMVVAVLSGLWFTFITWFFGLFRY